MLREQEAVDQASEAQRRLIQALRNPACYPHPVRSISIIEKILSRLVEGTSQVDTYEVSNSTFHKVAAAATA